MGKIGLTTDFPDLNRAGFPWRRFFFQHVPFDTGRRRTRLGIVKKEGKQNKSRWYGSPLLLAPKILPFPKWGSLSFQFPFQSSYVFPRHFIFRGRSQKKEMDKFLFLGTHTRKRIMVTPPLTTSFSFMNFIVIEIHDRICNLLSSCLAGKDLPLRKDWFIRIDMRVQLHCIARIHVVYLKQLTPLLLSWYNPLPAEPPFSSVRRDKM